MGLAEKIKKHRKMLNMTQNDMALILGVHRATCGEYELGNNQPPIDKLVKIADTFKVSVDYLLGREDQQTIDVAETLDYILKMIENNETQVKFKNNSLNGLTNKLIATSLEHTLKVAKLSIKD